MDASCLQTSAYPPDIKRVCDCVAVVYSVYIYLHLVRGNKAMSKLSTSTAYFKPHQEYLVRTRVLFSKNKKRKRNGHINFIFQWKVSRLTVIIPSIFQWSTVAPKTPFL